MDLENIMPSEINQTEKEKYYMMWHMQNTNERIWKTETHSDIENKLMVPKGEKEEDEN